MPSRTGRKTLRQGLDDEILQVVRKYQDGRPESDITRIPSEQAIYVFIQRSNSTLKRKPKQILEASIERVLDVLREDLSDSDPGDIEIDFQEPKESKPDRGNFMNKALRASMAPSPTPASEKQKDGPRQPNGEPARKKRRPNKEEIESAPPSQFRLADVGGVGEVIQQLEKHLVLPLLRPEKYITRKIAIPRGILLHGPPGCGKTLISRAFAAELGVPFIEILGPSVVSGMSGESEQKIRERFDEAKKLAPCLLFIDEIDAIAPKRDSAGSGMEKRIVTQLLISMDGLAVEENDGKPVIVLAATNRPDSLDPALRRGGRFDAEINLGVPNEPMRKQILKAQTRQTPLGDDVDFDKLAKMTSGFVGADLRSLVGKAGEWSMERYSEALKREALEMDISMDIDSQDPPETPSEDRDIRSCQLLIKRAKNKTLPDPLGFEDDTITMEAFLAVLPTITPSSKREGFATIPDTTWKDIGALKDVRSALEMAIVKPIQEPERFTRLGLTSPAGVLLWGPPGCGKTLLAKAVARESKANFISVKGPELLNKVTSFHLNFPPRSNNNIVSRRVRTRNSPSFHPRSVVCSVHSVCGRDRCYHPEARRFLTRGIRPSGDNLPHRARRPFGQEWHLYNRSDKPTRSDRPSHAPTRPPRKAPLCQPTWTRGKS
jgi:ribosome biogenesis ATPase